ncbi:pre-rRNA processing protein [Umbelopsis nana]
METKFAKIRTQINSKLENQKQYAGTLLAIEEALTEQNAPLTPTGYFAAMMAALQSANGSPQTRGCLVYLLDEVFPELPQSVLRQKYGDVLPILSAALEEDAEDQPVARSTIGCIEPLLIAQDGSIWNQLATKKVYQALLLMSVDGKPKSRKRAQDAVKHILSRPPPPHVQHPASNMTAEFTLRVLKEATKTDQNAAQKLLALLKSIVPYWPSSQFVALCQLLLQLPKFNNPHLTQSSFEVFEALFSAETISFDEDKFAQLLRSLCELKPAGIDDRLLPTWLLVITKAYPAFARMNAEYCAAEITTVIPLVFQDLEVPSNNHAMIAGCLSALIQYCVTDKMINEAQESENTPLRRIIGTIENGLGIRYQHSWTNVLTIVQALFRRLHRSSSPLLNQCLSLLGDLRLSAQETYKEQLDKTLGAAIATMGPEAFLNILPLNLESPASSGSIGRAFLLPLLIKYTTNTSLAYFVNVLMPLGDRLSQKAESFSSQGLDLQAKVYETLVNQIWSLATGFCDLPYDLRISFDNTVAERLSSVLYSHPDLRPTISQALQFLVQKNQSLVSSAADDADLQKAYGITKTEADLNLKHMSQFAVNFLAVFFNVYSQVPPMYRGFLGEVIKAYLKITPAEDVNNTFKKVVTLLGEALANPDPSPAVNDPSIPPPMSHTMMDLAIIMIPFLDMQSAELLYNGVTSALLGKEDEPILQKKAYKVINHLASCENGTKVLQKNLDNLQTRVLEGTMTCAPSSKKDRIKALGNIVSILPSNDLHLIPSILSEAVMATKEVNEKTRGFAFNLLVEMGNKMKEGGTVVNSKIQGMDESVPDADANITEYFTMVTAGLAGSTAHMISATITSLSRLFFEFKESLPQQLLFELLETMEVFVNSNNREVVKSALGFVKVAIVTLDSLIIGQHLPTLISGLLNCNKQHKSHFKSKVRHIFERLIRTFGYDRVAELVPEEDKKLVLNIKKRRDRSKRAKNANRDEDEDEIVETAPRQARGAKTGADAYEEAVYGSESEIEDSDEDDTMQGVKESTRNADKKSKKTKFVSEAYIREDADGPLDFLDRTALSRISSSKPQQKSMAQRYASRSEAFNAGEDGRLVINDSDDEGSGDAVEEDNEAENYYMQAQNSADGFTRGQGNKIKFKKRGKESMFDDDMMEVDDKEKRTKKKIERKLDVIGKEYRSKRAGGDVKVKGKADPHAYVPLSKITKKKGRHGPGMTFTGKYRK